MARVGTISIDLVAHTGKLNAPLLKASANVQTFVSSLHGANVSLLAMLSRIAALTGGILSLYAAFSKIRKQFEDIDSIAKSADRLGLTTEQFIGLQHGAELAGVGVEQLTKSLQKLLAQKTVRIAPEVERAETIQQKLDGMELMVPVNVSPDTKKMQSALDAKAFKVSSAVNVDATGITNAQKSVRNLISSTEQLESTQAGLLAGSKKLASGVSFPKLTAPQIGEMPTIDAPEVEAIRALEVPKISPVEVSVQTASAEQSVKRFASVLETEIPQKGVNIPITLSPPGTVPAVTFPPAVVNASVNGPSVDKMPAIEPPAVAPLAPLKAPAVEPFRVESPDIAPVSLSVDSKEAEKSIHRFSQLISSELPEKGIDIPIRFSKPNRRDVALVEIPPVTADVQVPPIKPVEIDANTSGAQKAVSALSKGVSELGHKSRLKIDAEAMPVTADVSRAAKAIDSLKQSASELVTIQVSDTSSALDMVADTMAGMATDAERLRYAIEVFGKDGAAMVDFLKDGAAGLRSAQMDAEKLGLTLSRVDAAKIEMANDAVSRLQALITGVARKIAIELAPFIKFAADQFVVLGTEGEGVGGKVRAGVDLAISGLGLVLDAIDLTRTAWASVQLTVQQVVSGIVGAIATMVKTVEIAAESIVNGFRSAWAYAGQIVSEAIGKMIALLAETAVFIESKLPERFQLGIAKSAQAFSEGFDQVVAQNRKDLEATNFNVDFKFGDSAMQFSKTLSEDVARSGKEFTAFANREKLSDKLRRNVDKIRSDAQKAAEAAAAAPDKKPPQPSAEKVTPAALERGSQQAFAAFQKNLEAANNPQVTEQKKTNQKLDTIIRKGVVLTPARVRP